MAPFNNKIFLLFALFVYTTRVGVVSTELHNKIENCDDLVASGTCRKDPVYMMENCALSCSKWQDETQYVKTEVISDDDPQFFDLSANSSTGHKVNFERFEGYLTIVTNIVKDCGGSEERGYQAIEQLHKIWPYALEIIVFTFEHPSIDYETKDCAAFDVAFQKRGRSIHVMEMAVLNGPDAHPVYKFFQDAFNLDENEIPNEYATFFLVNPDGNYIEGHFGSSVSRMKEHILMHLKRDYQFDF